MASCPFCEILRNEAAPRGGAWAALRDRYPVAPGHTLLIPTRHIASLAELDESERGAFPERLGEIMDQLREEFVPDGFNVGINDGPAAGQTVMHLHVHVIPRFAGDVPDPRGGVRGVIPAKAKYWNDGEADGA